MTSLDVFEPIGQPGESTAGIEHGSVLCNETIKSSAPIANPTPVPGNHSVNSPCSCCANTPIQHAGVGSCLVQEEIPGETTTE